MNIISCEVRVFLPCHEGRDVIPRTVVRFITSCSTLGRLWVYLIVGDETTTLDKHLFCIQWLEYG